MQTSQKSVQLINKLFNIQPSEWPRVSLMFLMMAVTNAVAIWGATISYAAFLQQIGIDALPWILVLGAILSTVAVAIYSAFADRIANDRLLMAIYGINAFGVVIGLILLWFGSPLAYPLLYLFDLALTGVFNAHFVTYVNGYYDTQAAKRVLPVVIAGARVGGIVAGLSMSLLTAWFDPGAIIFIWFLGYVAMMILIWVTPYLLKQDQTKDTRAIYSTADSAKQTPSYLENIREGFRYTSQSAFLRWMAVGTFFLMVLMALIEYLSSKLLLETFGTEEAFANYLALLLGVANLIVLPILMFGISRLIARIGVGNAGMLFPAGSLLISGSMMFWPGLVTASLGYLDRTALRVAFQFPITNLLYNAVPLRVKGRARAFVGGLIDPVGSLVGGLILLLPLVAVAWFVPALIGVLAVVYLVSAWFIRQQYGRALLKLLEQQDFSTLFSQDASTLTVADPTVLNQLRQKLEGSTSPEFTLFMAQLISQMGGKNAVPILSEVVKTAEEGRTRAAICDVLTANNARGEEVRELYVSLLSDPEATVRESAIGGLEQLADSGDPQFVEHMLMMVQDPDINVRVRALLALAHGGNFYRQPRAVQVLEQILASEDAHQRAYGVRVLGGIGYHRSIRDLTEYLSDPADEVRLAAVTAIEELSQQKLPQLQTSGSDIPELIITKICSLSQDPVEQVRRTALVVLGRLGTPQVYQAMVDGLTDPSSQVRAIAADMLVQIGQEAIPMVQPNLDSPDPQRRKMAAVVLSRINRREFSPLIDAHINENLLNIYQNYTHLEAVQVYRNYRAVAVLQSALRNQNEELTDEIFYLLTAIHQAKTIKTITETLESNAADVRANAVEALETLTSPDTARLIAPLFQPDLPPSQYLLLGKEIWGISDPDPVATIGRLSTSELPWLRTLTIFALGEIGADLQPTTANPLRVEVETPVEEQPEPSQKRKTRRKRPADLLGVLDKLGNSEETKQHKPRHSPIDLLGALTGDFNQPDVKDKLSDPQHVSLAKTADTPLTLPEIEAMIDRAVNDPVSNVQFAAQAARRMLNGQYNLSLGQKEDHMLSVVEKIIFLKEVPFFEGMTVKQLEVLATVCEEEFFAEDTLIFNEGDDGGSMYVIVSGKVAIERQGPRKGSTVRLATLESHQYFGEMTLFDNSPRSALALAGQDTLTLSLRREPLIALARQYPDLSLELINVLSQRLREANTRIAELTRSRPRELQKLFDKLD